MSQALGMLHSVPTQKAAMRHANHPLEFADTVPDMRWLTDGATEHDLAWLGVESMHPLTWAPSQDAQLDVQPKQAAVSAPF
jgi:hypothetical protein